MKPSESLHEIDAPPLLLNGSWLGEPDPNAPRVLVVPDLHHRVDHGEYWLRQDFDSAVFLGDYFDAHDDTLDDARQMAIWLQKHLRDRRFTFIVGNHDVHYAFPGVEAVRYPGFSAEKAEVINQVLTREYWGRMRLACMAGPFLASHAGFSPIWVTPPTIKNILARCKKADQRLAKGHFDPVFGYGELPSGVQKFGGPLAMDFGYFVGIPGINQLVGHTRGEDVRVKATEDSTNLCLDVGNGEVAALVQGRHVKILRMRPAPPIEPLTSTL